MTREEFATGMVVLQAGIGREFSHATMEIWYRILGDLDAIDFGYAVDRYLAECTSGFPMPAHFRIFVDELNHGEPQDYSNAWAAVLKANSTNWNTEDWRNSIASFDDLTRSAVERIGGWNMLKNVRTDQLPTVLAQFRAAYQSEQKRVLRDRRLPAALRPNAARAFYRPLESEGGRVSAIIADRAASMFTCPVK